MDPDQQIELYRAARAIAWSYKLEQYDAAALKDLQRIVDKFKGSIIDRFANQLGAIQKEGSYTRQHFQNSLKELERLSLGLSNQLGEQLTISTSRIGSLALKEAGESLSVGGLSKMVNTVALSPEQFAAFFKRNPPAGLLIPKVMRNALNRGVIGRIEGELLDVLREGALTGQSYKRIVDKLSESFTDFNRHQLTTLTRTFFQTANAQAFDAVYQANQDIIEGKIWTNSNDDRVCMLCLSLGETLYKAGEKEVESDEPIPEAPDTFRDLSGMSKEEAVTYFGGPEGRMPDALRSYTGAGYRHMNDPLRAGVSLKDLPKRDYDDIVDLDKILKEDSLKENIILRRGMGFSAAEFEEFRKRVKVGAIFEDAGFNSTTTGTIDDYFLGLDINVKVTILAPKGSKGKFLQKYDGTRIESEFLLNRGSKFKVDSMVEISDKVHEMRLRLL